MPINIPEPTHDRLWDFAWDLSWAFWVGVIWLVRMVFVLSLEKRMKTMLAEHMAEINVKFEKVEKYCHKVAHDKNNQIFQRDTTIELSNQTLLKALKNIDLLEEKLTRYENERNI